MSNSQRGGALVAAAVIAIAVLGCGGPSAKQIEQARGAKYDAPPEVVFNGVVEAVGSVQKIAGQDPSQGLIETETRWYEPDGTLARRGSDDEAFVTDGAILLGFLVGVRGQPGAWHVEVLPIAYQHRSGSPQAREMRPDDPQMPGWVKGKIDNIFLAVHGKLKEYEVGAAPAP
jgi:hypothetical protein